MWQTPSAQSREIGQIDSDMRVFDSELKGEAQHRGYFALPIGFESTPKGLDADAKEMFTDIFGPEGAARIEAAITTAPQVKYLAPTGTAANDPIVRLYYSVWLPFFHRWQAFYTENKDGAWWSNPAAEAEGYQRQLVQIRANAARLGMKIASPAPEMFSPSLLDPHHDVVDTAGDAAKEAAKIGKYALYGALGIGGAVLVASIVQNVRSGDDPIGKYVSYARRR